MLDKTRNWLAEVIAPWREFKAARHSRLENDWIVSPLKTNEEIKKSLRTLILRSRDLSKNNSDYIKWLNMREVNIVGHNGIKLMMKVKNPNGTIDKKANNTIETNWATWGKKRNGYCTIDKTLDWVEVQALVDREVALTGDGFIRKIKGADNPYLFALQFIDSLDIDIDYNVENFYGNRIIMGIEIDNNDRPVAYYKLNHQQTPGMGGTHERIPADEMYHVFHTRFVGQVRGYPAATGAILDLNMADAYKETSLVGARAAAAQMGIWEPSTAAVGKIKPGQAGSDDAPPETDVQPGKILRGKRGWSFKSFLPSQPVSGFSAFMKSINRSIANGLLVSYNYFRNDLEGVNFSSLRGGAIAERDNWKCEQRFLVASFVELVFADWLKMFLLSGLSNLPFSKFSKFLADTWLPRRWDWVDPAKDAKANQAKRDLGVISTRRICAELGTDYDEIQEEIKQEELDKLTLKSIIEVKRKELGLPENEEKTEKEKKGKLPNAA